MIYLQVVILSMTIVLASTYTSNIDTSALQYDYTTNNYYPECAPVEENRKPSNGSYPDDGCGDYSVRFKSDGNCYPLLKRGPCSSIYYWVTVDPDTYEGVCTPRLCGRNRVFVGCTGLCHDINDPEICRGGRRLFYSAYGDPMCDCPVGQYPFPNEGDDCVPLFTQGPCPEYHVVTPSSSGKLECAPNVCPAPFQSVDNFILQLFAVSVDDDDGEAACFAMGTYGPCYSPTKIFGYNIFQLHGECVDLKDPATPYYSCPRTDALIDEAYNRAGYPGSEKQNKTSSLNQFQSLTRSARTRRQNTFGIFQQPTNYASAILNGCQLGDRSEYNYKCSNPLVPDRPVRDVSAALNSIFACQGRDRLQATGQCKNNNQSASCGPSQIYDRFTGRCKPRR